MLVPDYDRAARDFSIPRRTMADDQIPNIHDTESCCVRAAKTVESKCCLSRRGWLCLAFLILFVVIVGFLCELRAWLAVDRARLEARLLNLASTSESPVSSSSLPSPSPLWTD